MKTLPKILAVLSIVFVIGGQGFGYAKTNSLVILDDESGMDFTDSAMALISTHCGEIYHVFRGKVLIGYIPEDKVNVLLGKFGILNVYQNTIFN